MKLLSTALSALFLFSCIVVGVALANKGSLMSFSGIIVWAFGSALCFLILSLACTPMLVLFAMADTLLRWVGSRGSK